MVVKWLKQAPTTKISVTYGKPWSKGELPNSQFRQMAYLGEKKLQSKVLAYWPDGSIKWTSHTGIYMKEEETFEDTQLSWETDSKEKQSIAVEKYNGIYVDNGLFQAYLPKHGNGENIIDWIKIENEVKLHHFRLGTQVEGTKTTMSVDSIELEENGPLKAIVKVTGKFKVNKQNLQEFIIRLRFYQQLETFDVVHTLIINQDVPIEGVYLTADVPLKGEPWNRHFSIAGEEGVYTEAAQSFISRRHWQGNTLYDKQLLGQTVILSEENQEMLRHAKENALWNNFNIIQENHRSYKLIKQTRPDYTPIEIGYGNRAPGVVSISGETGGVAVGIEKFWEKAPREIEVCGLTEKDTQLTAWLWSPKSQKMLFSHYSERDHMLSAYEGMEEIRSTAIGVGNTNTLKFQVFSKPKTKEELWAFSREIVAPAKIVFEPKDYYDTKVFGTWSLPNYSNPVEAFLERQMRYLRDFYVKEIEQRDWYGFWNYGDVMHTYDQARHTWRYDLGGYAWQNTELVPNLWLWQDFLRTGDYEAFYLAEAMTKHTSEVDQYHLGEYCGLGSRHNVLHWGCQCKEARISAAGLHRYYYYLTGDERTGDLMSEVKDNELSIFDELAPLREFYPEKMDGKYPIRVGPDWAALTSNWFTQWERTGDKSYLERIRTGIKGIKETPHRLLSGPTYLFDKETKELSYFGTGNVGGYHMIISFGAPQYWLEIAQNINNPEWREMLAEFGRFYCLPDLEKREQTKNLLYDQHFAWPMFATGLMGYAANFYQDETLAALAWEILLKEEKSGVPLPMEKTEQEAITWKKVTELPWISTNVASQWCLNVILCLEFIREYLPKTIYKMEEEK